MITLYVKETPIGNNCAVTSNELAYSELKDIGKADQETLWVLGMNGAKKNPTQRIYSYGGISSALVDPKILFRRLLQAGCVGFIIAHNHPSGEVRPSEEDIALTKRIREIAEIIGIDFLDHLIIGDMGYYSFREVKI